MRYHSRASRKEKDYVVHPQRLVHVQGGLYLWAFVPAYAELLMFAVERVRRVALQEESFTPIPELDTDPFKNSLGAYRGAVTRVVFGSIRKSRHTSRSARALPRSDSRTAPTVRS